MNNLFVLPSDVETSRRNPSDQIFSRLVNIRWGLLPPTDAGQIIENSEEFLQNRYRLNNRPTVSVEETELWAADPYNDPTWQFHVQALLPVKILLSGYEEAQDPRYLEKALSLILSWLDWSEQKPVGVNQLNEGGYVWHDHATAERAQVLTNFWFFYRNSEIYEARVGRRLLKAIFVHASILKNYRLYTYNSNHGEMQDLGLLHLAAGFPEILDGSYAYVAISRLTGQLKTLVSPEGVVLEHSPSYHLHTMRILRSAAGYLSLLGRNIPESWQDNFDRMAFVLAQFIQPDMTFPAIGDTVEDTQYFRSECEIHQYLYGDLGNRIDEDCNMIIAGKIRRESVSVWPWSGYAIYWDETRKDARQILTAWSYFPKHLHKHADELSIYLYANGRSWLIGPGNWPYWSSERSYARSWASSNAPYYEGEKYNSVRNTQLRSFGNTSLGNFLDLERTGSKGLAIRRQIFWLRPDNLLVFDSFMLDPKKLMIFPWHFAPDLEVSPVEDPFGFRFSGQEEDTSLQVLMAGSKGFSARLFSGSEKPYQGWIYTTDSITATPTIVATHNKQSGWVFSWFSFTDDLGKLYQQLQVNYDGQPEQWSVVADCGKGSITIERRLGTIDVSDANCSISAGFSVDLTQVEESEIEKVRAYRKEVSLVRREIPKYTGNYMKPRFQLLPIVLLVAVIQEIGAIILRKYYPRWSLLLRAIFFFSLIAGTTYVITRL